MPKTIVKVIDEQSNPISGAKIRPYALRSTQKTSIHYIWFPQIHGEPKTVLTDRTGCAEIQYPKYVEDKLETGEISFCVRHQEYSSVCIDDYSVQGQSRLVVLKKGAIVRASGYIGDINELVADQIYPQVTTTGGLTISANSWNEIRSGVYETRQVRSGTNFLSLVHLAKNGQIYFSEILRFEAQQTEVFEFHLELKLGVWVEGRLDDSVPRPVTGGKVVARVAPVLPETPDSSIAWRTWRNIDSDGRFVFESFPPEQLQLTGVCDGYVSTSPDNHSQIVQPQLFAVDKGIVNVELAMKPAAMCEVRVIDAADHPISGAKVYLNPAVKWQGGGTQFFPGTLMKSEETLTMDADELTTLAVKSFTSDYRAVTDDQGVAVIRNLPGPKDRLYVVHERYEMIIDKKSEHSDGQSIPIDLASGRTTAVTVKMQKK